MSAVVIPDPLRETNPPTERTLDQRRRRQGSALLKRRLNMTPNGRRFGPRECLCEVHFEPVSGCRPIGRCVVGHGCTPLYRRNQQRAQSEETEIFWIRSGPESEATASSHRLRGVSYRETTSVPDWQRVLTLSERVRHLHPGSAHGESWRCRNRARPVASHRVRPDQAGRSLPTGWLVVRCSQRR